ncbi:MAG: phosphoenolpyruvate-utilizing N-terminal domain-containing protein [Chthoniobacteraceae bacterium]
MKTERRFQGVGVSPGIARGTAFVHAPDEELPPRYAVAPDQFDRELARLHDALTVTRRQIVDLQTEVENSLGAKDAAIFEAHLMVVEDGVFIGEVEKTMRAEGCNAEHAFASVIHRYVKSLAKVDDPYLRERAVDIQDVGHRVIHDFLISPRFATAHVEHNRA